MIVYCCHDLIFATKIHSTAQSLSLVCRPARDAKALRNRLNRVDDGKPNDPVSGVVIDLTIGEAALDLIKLAKGHDAGPKVVAFAPHVEVELIDAAVRRGADTVMPRGAFSAQLPDLLCALAQKPKQPIQPPTIPGTPEIPRQSD